MLDLQESTSQSPPSSHHSFSLSDNRSLPTLYQSTTILDEPISTKQLVSDGNNSFSNINCSCFEELI